MDQIIGSYKEYVIIERKVLDEMNEKAIELDSNSKGVYSQGIAKGIHETIELIKEKNIYTQDLQIKR